MTLKAANALISRELARRVNTGRVRARPRLIWLLWWLWSSPVAEKHLLFQLFYICNCQAGRAESCATSYCLYLWCLEQGISILHERNPIIRHSYIYSCSKICLTRLLWTNIRTTSKPCWWFYFQLFSTSRVRKGSYLFVIQCWLPSAGVVLQVTCFTIVSGRGLQLRSLPRSQNF